MGDPREALEPRDHLVRLEPAGQACRGGDHRVLDVVGARKGELSHREEPIAAPPQLSPALA